MANDVDRLSVRLIFIRVFVLVKHLFLSSAHFLFLSDYVFCFVFHFWILSVWYSQAFGLQMFFLVCSLSFYYFHVGFQRAEVFKFAYLQFASVSFIDHAVGFKSENSLLTS